MSLYQYLKKIYPHREESYPQFNPKYQYLTSEDTLYAPKLSSTNNSYMNDKYGGPTYIIEQDAFNPAYRYFGSEGRRCFQTEQDYSNPKYMDWYFTSPTFIIQKIDVEKLRAYITELLNEHDSQFADQITNIVIEHLSDQMDVSMEERITEAVIQKMQDNINLTIDQAIQQVFVEMTEEAIDQAFGDE